MKVTKQYSEKEVVHFLKQKGCEFIKIKGGLYGFIEVSNTKNLGNGSWGKLDFLMNYHNYFLSIK